MKQEVQTESPYSAQYLSPSNGRERNRRGFLQSFFPTNPRPLDIQKEIPLPQAVMEGITKAKALPPAEKDKLLASPATNLARHQSGHVTARDAFLIGGAGGLAVAAALFLAQKVSGYDIYENGEGESPATRDIGSVNGPTSFNNDGSSVPKLVDSLPQSEQAKSISQVDSKPQPVVAAETKPKLETKRVKAEEVFDPYAKEAIISDKNTIEMTLEEYQKIAPATIDRKTPEKINIGLSIENADGSNNIGRVVLKKRPDYIGGGERTTNFRIDPQTQERMYDGQVLVNSNLIFKEGLESKKVSLIIKDAKRVTIENKSEENTQNLKRGGFHMHIESNNGDTSAFIIGTTAIQLTQHFPPARSENLGGGQWKLVSTPVTIESSEGITIVPLGIITTSSKQNFNSGVVSQMSIISVSTVTDENGLKQVGPAEIMLTTSDGKFINLKVN